MHNQSVLIFGVGVRPEAHSVAEMADIKALTSQPVFKRSEVLEEYFPHRLSLLAGNMWSGVDTVGVDDKVSREHGLCNITQSVREGG